MVLKLFYDLKSQPARAVYVFMKAANVDFEPCPVDLMKGEHKTGEYAKSNPMQQVPALVDDGYSVTESAAIMRYIAVKCNLAEHWYPSKDIKRQSRVDAFLHWHHSGLRTHCISIFIPTLRSKVDFGPLPKQPLDEARVKTAKEGLTKALGLIGDHFLAGQDYVGGDDISVADIMGVMELIQLRGCWEEGFYESNPKIKAWVQRVEQRLGPVMEEATAEIRKIRQAFKDAK